MRAEVAGWPGVDGWAVVALTVVLLAAAAVVAEARLAPAVLALVCLNLAYLAWTRWMRS